MSDEKPNVIFQIANVGPGGIVAHTIENINSRNAGIDDPLKDYYRRLARECQLTTLTVIESDALATDEVCAIEIYVQPDVRIIDDGKAGRAGEAIGREGEPRRVPLLDCLTSTDPTMHRLVLTAPSGFGKSTAVNVYLQKLVAQQVPLLMLRLPALRKSASSHADKPASHRVELALAKDIAAKTDPSTNASKLATALIDRLDGSPGVILFDALDEVPQGERDEVVACVRTFLKERERKQTGHRVLITSRPYAYTGQFDKDNFRRVELAEFTPTQQDDLIGKWFAQSDKSLATGYALVAQISAARSSRSADHKALAALMTEPMLLTYACMLAHQRASAEEATDTAPLPSRRHDLFDGVVSLMLEKWDPLRKHGAVDDFKPLFSRTPDKPSALRQILERAALEELTEGAAFVAVEAALEEWKKSLAQQFAARNLSRERFVFWLDEMMPLDMPVRAHTVVDWLAQRSGLLQSVSEVHGVRFVLQAQLRDFLAVGGLRASVGNDYELVDSMLAKLRAQPQWYRPMMTMVLARLRGEARELTYAINGILAPRDDASDGLAHAHEILHFVIAWANAFGEARPNSQKNTALEQALTKLRLRCLDLVTSPAEGKPPIQLRAEAADALGLIGDPRFDHERWHLPAKRMLSAEDEPIPGFVRIAAGEFMMGDKREKDNPPQKVRIDHPFYIARYATTVAQFRHFVDEGGYEEQQWWDDDGLLWLTGEFDKRVKDNEQLRWLRGRPLPERRAPASWAQQLQSPSRSVTGVNWFEARAYTRWSHDSLGDALAATSLAKHRATLPTDPQWERAARWAANDAGYDSRRWPWDDNSEVEFPTHANICRLLGQVVVVGLYESTGPVLFDIVGNTWEWMDNSYLLAKDERLDRVSRNHKWSSASKRQDSEAISIRGGCWLNPPASASCTYRDGEVPDLCGDGMGFRVVLSLPENET